MSSFKKLMPVVRRDPRYAYEAYLFVFQAIDHTLKYGSQVTKGTAGGRSCSPNSGATRVVPASKT